MISVVILMCFLPMINCVFLDDDECCSGQHLSQKFEHLLFLETVYIVRSFRFDILITFINFYTFMLVFGSIYLVLKSLGHQKD